MSARAVPFLDLGPSQEPLREALAQVWARVTSSGRYVGGQEVARFEERWASSCGTAQAVGVANGTDAIELTLRGLGIGRGDEVLVPANTFIATAEAIVAAGATPVFIDVDSGTLLVTPRAMADAIGSATAAVVVVHLYGQAADMTALVRAASAAGIALVEDCAQAHGATWEGQTVGSFGAAGAFSFYPGKNLGAFGDAGAVVTSDAALARRVRQLADHGRVAGSRYEHEVVGRNSRLDALQAGVLGVKLDHLSGWNASRREAHRNYERRLAGVDGVRLVEQRPGSGGSHHLEVVRTARRDLVVDLLAERGVEVGIHYPVPCPHHRPYRDFPTTDIPVAQAAAGDVLSLPLFPGITDAQIGLVCDTLAEAVQRAAELAPL